MTLRWLIDASNTRHSGALSHQEELLPAIDADLDGDEGLVLASPALSATLRHRLARLRVDEFDVGLGLRRFAALNVGIRRRIRRFGPDAAVFSQYAPVGLAVPYVLRVTDAHYVDDGGLRGVLPYLRPAERAVLLLRGRAFRSSVRRAAALLCPTRATAEQLKGKWKWVDPARVHVAPYGPSPLARRPERHAGTVANRRLLTMHVRPRKNVEVILHALARPELRGWTLTVMADLEASTDAYGVHLRELVEELGLAGRVRSAGYQATREGVLELMLEHDLLLSMSRVESWNHTVVEGMALGMPVIASDIACHREVTRGGARLVDPDDPAALAGAILEVEGAGDDTAARRRRGLQVVEELSWKDHAEAVIRLLREVAPPRVSQD